MQEGRTHSQAPVIPARSGGAPLGQSTEPTEVPGPQLTGAVTNPPSPVPLTSLQAWSGSGKSFLAEVSLCCGTTGTGGVGEHLGG